MLRVRYLSFCLKKKEKEQLKPPERRAQEMTESEDHWSESVKKTKENQPIQGSMEGDASGHLH